MRSEERGSSTDVRRGQARVNAGDSGSEGETEWSASCSHRT